MLSINSKFTHHISWKRCPPNRSVIGVCRLIHLRRRCTIYLCTKLSIKSKSYPCFTQKKTIICVQNPPREVCCLPACNQPYRQYAKNTSEKPCNLNTNVLNIRNCVWTNPLLFLSGWNIKGLKVNTHFIRRVRI